MDIEQLLDKVQNLLLGIEERVNGRFQAVDSRFNSLDTKLESVRSEVKLHNELLAPFINWSHRMENEVIRLSAQLQDVQGRLAKLEKAQ